MSQWLKTKNRITSALSSYIFFRTGGVASGPPAPGPGATRAAGAMRVSGLASRRAEPVREPPLDDLLAGRSPSVIADPPGLSGPLSPSTTSTTFTCEAEVCEHAGEYETGLIA